MPFMYILECSDRSLYVGSTWDLDRRLARHQEGEGAVYTRSRRPVRLLYYEHFDRIEEDIAQRLAHPFAERAYRAQGFAAGLHNCYGHLPRIDVSTLVVHGRHDRMIPVANAQLIAERIPGADLQILEESGHLYATEEPEVDEAIAAFLEEAGEAKQ